MQHKTMQMVRESARTVEELQKRITALERQWAKMSRADGLHERVAALEAEWKRRRGGRPRKHRDGETEGP